MSKKNRTAILALLMIMFSGCGTSDYEQRLQARITELKSESKFNILSPPIDVPGTSVSIRIPQKNEANIYGFENQPLTEGAIIEGNLVDARRVGPEVVSLPELKLTFEGFVVDASGGKQPFYLYVAVTSDPRRANYPRSMRVDLRNKYDDTTELSDLQAQTPDGRSTDWKTCRATGNQDFFYITPDGKGQYLQMPGLIELLFHEDNDLLVILAWRLPTGIEQTINLQKWIRLVAGCVKVKSD
jgi:hypothetical protein